MTLEERPSDENVEPLWVKCDCDVDQELRGIEGADAANDATKRIGEGDARFIGIMEYSVLIPGVDDRALVERQGVRVIAGTSDVVRCFEQARLTKIATQYAEQYNAVILDVLSGREK
jgi:hypothetical protein